jgi:hypothetical protein
LNFNARSLREKKRIFSPEFFGRKGPLRVEYGMEKKNISDG